MFADGESSLELHNVEIEDLVDVFSIDGSVGGKIESNFLVKRVDEEVEELVLVDFSVCLLGLEHTFSKQTF